MAPQDGLGIENERQPGMPASDAGYALVTTDQNKAKVGGRTTVKSKLGKGASLVSVAEQLHVFDNEPNAADIKRILNATSAAELAKIEQWILDALAPGNNYNIDYLCNNINPQNIAGVDSVTFSMNDNAAAVKELRITITPILKK